MFFFVQSTLQFDIAISLEGGNIRYVHIRIILEDDIYKQINTSVLHNIKR